MVNHWENSNGIFQHSLLILKGRTSVKLYKEHTGCLRSKGIQIVLC